MNKHSKTSLFLMELIIALLLFSVTAAVCVRVFVATYLTNEKTKLLQFASIETQNIAEQIRGNVWNFETDTLAYDKEFRPTEKDQASYLIQIHHSLEQGLLNITIETEDLEHSEEVYTLSFKQYQDYSAGKGAK